jgi:hypothetical protein
VVSHTQGREGELIARFVMCRRYLIGLLDLAHPRGCVLDWLVKSLKPARLANGKAEKSMTVKKGPAILLRVNYGAVEPRSTGQRRQTGLYSLAVCLELI